MNKQFIYFTSIMVLMAATIVAVSGQENLAGLSNIINNTTLNAIPNETLNASLTSNGSVSIPAPVVPAESTITNNTSLMEKPPALNENLPAQNATDLQNVTIAIEGGNNSSATEEISAIQVIPLEPEVDTVFSIGGGLKSNQIFQIHGSALPRQTYEVGMPIKPLRDTSKMFFACNII